MKLILHLCLVTFAVSLLAETQQPPAQTSYGVGVLFENRVLGQMMGKKPTSLWTIPGEANRANPGTPALVRFQKWGTPIYLGEALDQIKLAEDFEFIVGFYEPEKNGKSLKVVALHQITVIPERWHQLWGTLKTNDMMRLQAIAKTGAIDAAQQIVGKEITSIRPLTGGMDIFPVINTEQRRIYCSIPFQVFYRFFLGDASPAPQRRLMLWGRPFPAFLPLDEMLAVPAAAQTSAKK